MVFKRQYRLPSYHWLCALDHQLKATTGAGLAQFRTQALASKMGPAAAKAKAGSSKDKAELPEPFEDTGKTLCLSIDQGSDGWCPAQWGLYGARW